MTNVSILILRCLSLLPNVDHHSSSTIARFNPHTEVFIIVTRFPSGSPPIFASCFNPHIEVFIIVTAGVQTLDMTGFQTSFPNTSDIRGIFGSKKRTSFFLTYPQSLVPQGFRHLRTPPGSQSRHGVFAKE